MKINIERITSHFSLESAKRLASVAGNLPWKRDLPFVQETRYPLRSTSESIMPDNENVISNCREDGPPYPGLHVSAGE